MSETVWSAAAGCADPLRLEEALQAMKSAACHELHVDVMDGAFVQSFGQGEGLVAAAKEHAGMPVDVHLMTERPELHIERFVAAGCVSLTLHVEASVHIHRALAQIRDLGASPGVAINPSTSLTALEYVLPLVDRVLVVGREPGRGTGSLPGAALERVKILRENIVYQERRVQIQVEGVADPTDAARVIEMGAGIVVIDAPEVYAGASLEDGLRAFMADVANERRVV